MLYTNIQRFAIQILKKLKYFRLRGKQEFTLNTVYLQIIKTCTQNICLHTINDLKKTETVDQHSSHLYTSKYSDIVHVLLYYRVVVQFQYTLMCEDAQKHPINFIRHDHK